MTDTDKKPSKPPSRKKTKAPPPEGSMADIMARKKGYMTEATIQLDGEIRSKIEEANLNVLKARQADKKSNAHVKSEPKAKEIYDALVAQGKETEVIFKFRGIGRVKYEDLVRKHSDISEEQKKAGMDVDMPNFAPELIAASSYEPKISLTYAREIWNSPDWNSKECDRLFVAARDANSETPDIPLSSDGIETILSSILR